jgi:hypothetical protein
MKISDFMKKTLDQIKLGCKDAQAQLPDRVEFCIHINDKSEVCKEEDSHVGIVTLKEYNPYPGG